MLWREGHGLRVGQKAGVDREGDEGSGEGRGSDFSTEHHEAAGGAGTALQPPLNTSRNSSKASLVEGLTALPDGSPHVDEALLCSQAAPAHDQQLGDERCEEGPTVLKMGDP